MEELSQQQQIVIDAIAMNWDAIPLKKLSLDTGLAINQLSPQLNRLLNDGWIEKVEADKKSRKTKEEVDRVVKGNAYFICERFFNIWFLIRRSNRRQKRGVHSLSEFLECLYGPERMRQDAEIKIDKILSELHNTNKGLAKEYLLRAFKILEEEDKISTMSNDHWLAKFGSVILGLNYGSWLLAILEEKGYDIVLSPYYTAIQALEIEKQDNKNGQKDAEIYLKNRAIEISEPARMIIEKIKRYMDGPPLFSIPYL